MNVRQGSIEEAVLLLASIPELKQDHDLSYYKERLSGTSHLTLIAEADGLGIGFKVGYALSAEHFYSWVGGVCLDYRKLGAAQLLLTAQETWAWQHGYLLITVKTSGQFPAMRALLEKNAYEIVNRQEQQLTYRKLRPSAPSCTN